MRSAPTMLSGRSSCDHRCEGELTASARFTLHQPGAGRFIWSGNRAPTDTLRPWRSALPRAPLRRGLSPVTSCRSITHLAGAALAPTSETHPRLCRRFRQSKSAALAAYPLQPRSAPGSGSKRPWPQPQIPGHRLFAVPAHAGPLPFTSGRVQRGATAACGRGPADHECRISTLDPRLDRRPIFSVQILPDIESEFGDVGEQLALLALIALAAGRRIDAPEAALYKSARAPGTGRPAKSLPVDEQ